MKTTSLEAYRAGDFSTQQKRVFKFIVENPGKTRNEIAKETGVAINAVCGRVKMLLDKGDIRESTKRACTITGSTAYPLVCVYNKPEQGVLF